MTGSAVVFPEMHAPGTEHLRTSILAAWADVVAGYLAVQTVARACPSRSSSTSTCTAPPPGRVRCAARAR